MLGILGFQVSMQWFISYKSLFLKLWSKWLRQYLEIGDRTGLSILDGQQKGSLESRQFLHKGNPLWMLNLKFKIVRSTFKSTWEVRDVKLSWFPFVSESVQAEGFEVMIALKCSKMFPPSYNRQYANSSALIHMCLDVHYEPEKWGSGCALHLISMHQTYCSPRRPANCRWIHDHCLLSVLSTPFSYDSLTTPIINAVLWLLLLFSIYVLWKCSPPLDDSVQSVKEQPDCLDVQSYCQNRQIWPA